MKTQGFTLFEIIVATAIFVIVSTLMVSFFSLSLEYFNAGSSQADVQMETQYALSTLEKEVQQSDSGGIYPAYPNGSNDLVFISAQNSSGQFVVYNGSSNCGTESNSAAAGEPCWQGWVAYYLTPQSGTSYYELIRKEEFLPSSQDSTVVPTPIPTAASIETAAGPQTVMDQYVQSNTAFNVQTSCGISGIYYLQLTAEKVYGGELTSYNPGVQVNNGSCASGNWILALPEN
jgi:prepilin-type N-terminal cleavage/methylation domain-containing protein